MSHNHWLFRITSKPDESASSDVLILRKTIAYEQSLTASLLGLLASAAFGSAMPSQLRPEVRLSRLRSSVHARQVCLRSTRRREPSLKSRLRGPEKHDQHALLLEFVYVILHSITRPHRIGSGGATRGKWPNADAEKLTGRDGHGRDGRGQPPAVQIPARAVNAPGSSLGFWRRSGDRVAGVSFE